MIEEEEEGLGVFAWLAWMFKGWNAGRVARKTSKQSTITTPLPTITTASSTAHFDVKVSGDAVNQQEADEHASRVVGVPVGGVGFARFRPLTVLRLKLELRS